MAVVFDLGNGTTCSVQDNSQMMATNKGPKQADQIVQGDFICNVKGETFIEIVAPPVVS